MQNYFNNMDTPPNQIATSGSNAVAAGGDYFGWVSGDIASLPASTSVDCVFDLGPLWARYNWVMVNIYPVAPSSGLSAVQISGSASAAFDSTRRLQAVNALSFGVISAALTTSSGSQMLPVKPMGRYLVVRCTNADASNAQGATAHVSIAAYTS